MKTGKLIVIAAPSGSGKTTVVNSLVSDESLNLGFSVSTTSRPKRENEIEGKDYYFLSNDEFQKKIHSKEFIEWEEVYEGAFYGTLKSELEKLNSSGKNIIFDIDVVGGISIKQAFPDKTITFFISPPSIEELENRLRKRGTEQENSIQVRLAKATKEMSMSFLYDYKIENHNIEDTINKIKTLINNFL